MQLIYGFLFCNRRKKSFNSRVRFHCINLPTYSSDTESDGSSESNESPPRSSYSMESIETIFPPWRSPNHSDSFENFEEIFPIDHFISTSSTRTLPTLVSMMFDRGVQVPNCTNPLSRNQLSHTAP